MDTYKPGTWAQRSQAPLPPPVESPAVPNLAQLPQGMPIIVIQNTPPQPLPPRNVQPRPWGASGAGFGWILLYLLLGAGLCAAVTLGLWVLFGDGELPKGWP